MNVNSYRREFDPLRAYFPVSADLFTWLSSYREGGSKSKTYSFLPLIKWWKKKRLILVISSSYIKVSIKVCFDRNYVTVFSFSFFFFYLFMKNVYWGAYYNSFGDEILIWNHQCIFKTK